MKDLINATASGGQRIGASLVDFVVNVIFAIPIIIWAFNQITIFKSSIAGSGTVIIYGLMLGIIFQLIIPILTKGKTIGKAVVGLRMISSNGDYASGGQLFARSLIYTVIPILEMIPVLGSFIEFIMFIIFIISLVLIFTDICHQAVHDKISSIYVVDDIKYILYKKRRAEKIEQMKNC